MDESALRKKYGIPSEAQRVLLFTESSHWDPNWILTSTEYFGLRVRRNLDMAIAELVAEPRRIYSIECAFFMDMYWRARPDNRETIVKLMNEGRLRLMGSGVTTPDTLIPCVESLIRDYLIGFEWYKSRGIMQVSEVAYFPDSFGHAPTVPSIMRELGVSGVGICRIDGQYLIGRETDKRSNFPRRGTSADLLMNKERSQDFIWRGGDGAQVFAHWAAYGYGFGEMLAHNGATRAYGLPIAWPAREDSQVAAKVDKFVRKLSKTSRTPYMLCPIGFDFEPPIHRLLDLLDSYNERIYPSSGIWLLNGGLDDYMKLIACHKEILPTLELDPNPYFSGFYTSRPTIKRKSFYLIDSLLSLEALASSNMSAQSQKDLQRDIESAWWIAATSNHHDFITGTSTDRVVSKEQIPWLDGASNLVQVKLNTLMDSTIDELARQPVLESSKQPEKTSSFSWHRQSGTVEVSGDFGSVSFDPELGGAISRLVLADGTNLEFQRPMFDILSYKDSGGLWRMGMEYKGGIFDLVDRASNHSGEISVDETDEDALVVRVEGILDGKRIERYFQIIELRQPGGGCIVAMSVKYQVPRDRTITCTTLVNFSGSSAITDMPGGVVERSALNYYEPTFWPVQSFAHTKSPDGPGFGILLTQPAAVALRFPTAQQTPKVGPERSPGFSTAKSAEEGLEMSPEDSTANSRESSPVNCSVEVALMRNCLMERFAKKARDARQSRSAISLALLPRLPMPLARLPWLPVPGMPVSGHDGGPHIIHLGGIFTSNGNWLENNLPQAVLEIKKRILSQSHISNSDENLRIGSYGHPGDLVEVDHKYVNVLAMKTACDGRGNIVRLQKWCEGKIKVSFSWPEHNITEAYLCDGLERDYKPLEVDTSKGTVTVEMDYALASIRILCNSTSWPGQGLADTGIAEGWITPCS